MIIEYGMTNLRDAETGLGNIVVSVYELGVDEKLEHGPRVNVSNIKGKWSSDCFSIDMNGDIVQNQQCKLDAKSVKRVVRWVRVNASLLTRLWYDTDYSVFQFNKDSLKYSKGLRIKIIKPK